MKLKRALQITIALRDQIDDLRLRKAIDYVLNVQYSNALDVWGRSFSKDMDKFFITELIMNNLRADYKGIQLVSNIPNSLNEPFLRCLERDFKPVKPIEKYVGSLFYYQWKTKVDNDVLNYFYNLHKGLDFYAQDSQNVVYNLILN